MEDLAQYEAQWRTPLSFKYKDLNIISTTKQEEYVLHKYLKWLHLMI
jgi:gamma-glutamyltranspeptidase